MKTTRFSLAKRCFLSFYWIGSLLFCALFAAFVFAQEPPQPSAPDEPAALTEEKLENASDSASGETAAIAGTPVESDTDENGADEANGANGANEAELAEKEPANEARNIPMKWIPSQKILRGGPPTAISLDGAIQRFRDEGAFGDSDLSDLKIEILSESAPETVEPEIAGRELILNWGEAAEGKSDVMVRLQVPERPPVFISVSTEVWSPNWWWMGAIVIGGLGIFIFGMNNMSEGVQLLAGPSLRRMIALFTEHRIMAFGVGIITTILLQSSSVTTVMVVGFINSQIMTLTQGIGVILGANIGTTVTGWILTLNIGKCGLPIAGMSVFFYLFCKNEKVRSAAEALMGLGLVFFGLQLMSDGFSSLRELPEFSNWMKMFAADSYFGALKCAMVGCLLTMVVQSSAATIGITMSLASIGAIEFSTAAALVLGENIGTTITAVLVAIGASTNARRAAAFHVFFNMIGVFWVLAIFIPLFLPFVTWLAGVSGTHNVTTGIAMAHTVFNVTNALLFLPFTRYFATLLTRLLPERESKSNEKKLTSLYLRHMETPAFAIERSRVEVLRMAHGCHELGGWIQKLVAENFEDDKLVQKAFEQEKTLDVMQDEIIDFTSEMLSKNLSAEVAESAREQLRMADELETVSDYLVSILKSDLKLKNDGLTIPSFVRDGFDLLHEETILQFEFIMKTFAERHPSREFLERIYANCRKLTANVKQLRGDFLKAMSDERFDPLVIAAVNSQLNFYRRLWEHQLNIAESFCGAK